MNRSIAMVCMALAGCATTGRVAALEARVQTLEDLLRDIGVSPEENEARQALEAAEAALRAGDFEGAGRLAGDLRARFPGAEASQRAAEIVAEVAPIGKPAPWSAERWLQGAYDPASKRVSMYVFFESWCPHCRRYVPELQKTWTTLGRDDVGLVGFTRLSRGTTDEVMRTFLAEQALTFPVAVDGGGMFDGLALDGVPAMAVVRDGTLIWKGHPAQVSNELIAEWLAE